MTGPCPRLLICEGYEDQQFFKYLIEARGIQPFKVIDTSNKPVDRQGGIHKFKRAINGAKQNSWYKALSDIVLVADNDDDPNRNFNIVAKQVDMVFNVRPDRALIPVNNRPRVTILMIPWPEQPGNLETLCVEAARSADNASVGVHVDTFMANIRSDRWDSECRKGKAWLRSNLAARCHDPFVTLGTVFTDFRSLINVRDRSLEQIVRFLAKVGA